MWFWYLLSTCGSSNRARWLPATWIRKQITKGMQFKGPWSYFRKTTWTKYLPHMWLPFFPLISRSSVSVAKDQTVVCLASLLRPGRWVLSAAHVMVSVARTQTGLLCPCLGPSDGWQRLLPGGNEEAKGKHAGPDLNLNKILFSPTYQL